MAGGLNFACYYSLCARNLEMEALAHADRVRFLGLILFMPKSHYNGFS